MLRKYVSDSSHILQDHPLEVQENLTYKERPLRVLDRKEQELQTKMTPMVKILWNNHGVKEVTWENEEHMKF